MKRLGLGNLWPICKPLYYLLVAQINCLYQNEHNILFQMPEILYLTLSNHEAVMGWVWVWCSLHFKGVIIVKRNFWKVRPKRKQFFSVGRAYANVGTASILWYWKSVHSHVWTHLTALRWTALSLEIFEPVNGHQTVEQYSSLTEDERELCRQKI